MFEAQYLVTDQIAGVQFYSPWMPRGGDYLQYTVDTAQVENGTFTVSLVHKDSETAGDGADVASSGSGNITGPGQTPKNVATALDELVRYKYKLVATKAGTTAVAAFRLLSPVWRDELNAGGG